MRLTQPSSQPRALNVNSQGQTSLLVNLSRRVSSQPDHPANFEDLYYQHLASGFLVVHYRYCPVRQWSAASFLLARATVAFGFSLSLGRYLLLVVLATHLLTTVGLGALVFDVGEGAGWSTLPSTAVHVSVPFHVAGVRFVGGLLSPRYSEFFKWFRLCSE